MPFARIGLIRFSCWILTFSGSLAAASAEPSNPATPPCRLWNVGDSWELELSVYARYGPPVNPPATAQPKYRYRMTVRVVGSETVDGVRCWQVNYSPGKDAPPEYRESFRVLVREDDGWVHRVFRNEELLGDSFITIDKTAILFHPPVGLPAELFFIAENKAEMREKGKPHWLRFTRRDLREVQVLESFLFSGEIAQVTVKQVWRKGEICWREYERHYNGRRDLIAKVVSTAALTPKGKTPPSSTPSIAPEDMKPPPGGDPTGLRNDPRLRTLIDLKLSNPTVTEVVAKLAEATGVPLTLADSTARRRAAYGSIDSHGFPAWHAMLQLASSEAVQGRWEKDGDGYRLVGTAADFEPDPAVPVASTPSRTRWRLTILTAVVVVVVTTVAFRRRHRAKLRATVKPEPPAGGTN